MKNLFLSFAFLLVSSLAFSQEITGKWLTDDKEAVVEIYKSGDKLNGKIIWLKKAKDGSGKTVDRSEKS